MIRFIAIRLFNHSIFLSLWHIASILPSQASLILELGLEKNQSCLQRHVYAQLVLASLINQTPMRPDSKFEQIGVRTAQQLDVIKLVIVAIDVTEIQAGVVVEAIVIYIDFIRICCNTPRFGTESASLIH